MRLIEAIKSESKPIHPSKVVEADRVQQAQKVLSTRNQKASWKPLNDANPDVGKNTEQEAKAPPPKPPCTPRDDRVDVWMRDAFKELDPEVVERRIEELHATPSEASMGEQILQKRYDTRKSWVDRTKRQSDTDASPSSVNRSR